MPMPRGKRKRELIYWYCQHKNEEGHLRGRTYEQVEKWREEYNKEYGEEVYGQVRLVKIEYTDIVDLVFKLLENNPEKE